MNRHLLRNVLGSSLLAVAMTAVVANAQSPLGNPFVAGSSSSSGSYTPEVPVSQFARSWIDPSHFHFSSSIMVGTGWSGSGTSALQVTSLAYQFSRPAWLSVSVGNNLGGPRSLNGRNGMFLEGLTFGFKPWANSVFQVQYKDVRSPLQYSNESFGAGFSPYTYPNRW